MPPAGKGMLSARGDGMRIMLLAAMAGMALKGGRRARRGGDAVYRRTAWALGGTILAAMALQEAILFCSGLLTWASALPLHLCSLMGLMALPALLTRRAGLLHALLYAGTPGALLALAFPAVLPTPWPRLTVLAFHAMHAALAAAPLLPLAAGWRPGPSGALTTLLFLLTAGAAAMAANALTGGNYLFLAGPVAGTPLMWLAGRGMRLYRLGLLALAALVLAAEGAGVWLLYRYKRVKS